jgi:hypothetical protein
MKIKDRREKLANEPGMFMKTKHLSSIPGMLLKINIFKVFAQPRSPLSTFAPKAHPPAPSLRPSPQDTAL